MNRMHSMLIVLVLALVLTACKPAASVPQGEPAAPIPAPSEEIANPAEPEIQPQPAQEVAKPVLPAIPDEPNPLSVSPLLDDDQAVEVTLPEAGGVIQAESGGVRYTLTVPEGALLSEQDLRMTPVIEIGGLPMSGGLIGAVKFEPEGLRFSKPAVLHITVPAGFDPQQVTGFAYSGAGQEFHLYPARVDGDKIEIELWHFSGYGSGAATSGDLDRQSQNPPTSAEARMHQQVADLLSRSAREGKDIPVKEIEVILRDYLHNVLLPLLQSAETDDQLVYPAGKQLLSFDRNVALLGMSDLFSNEYAQAYKSLEIGMKNAYDRSFQRCVDTPDAFEVPNMLKHLREIGWLDGIVTFRAGEYTFNEKFRDVQNCLKFVYKFESIIKWEFGNNMVMDSHVTTEIELTMDESLYFDGSGEMVYRSFEMYFQGESEPINQFCVFEERTKNATASIVGGRINWKNVNSTPEIQVFLPLNPGPPLDNFHIKCETGASGDWIELNLPEELAMWAAGFDHIHEEGRIEIDGGYAYIVVPFEKGSGRLFARHTSTASKTVETETVSETLAIDLFHTPSR
jgi:hypothetical protein